MILDATALAGEVATADRDADRQRLGRDGLLPSFFAKTSRHNTPWVGNLVIAIGGSGLILVGLYSHTLDRFGLPREFAAFFVAATAGSFAVELVYLILAVAAIGLLVRTNAVWWQYLVVLVAVATPVLGFWGALNPDPHDTTNTLRERSFQVKIRTRRRFLEAVRLVRRCIGARIEESGYQYADFRTRARMPLMKQVLGVEVSSDRCEGACDGCLVD